MATAKIERTIPKIKPMLKELSEVLVGVNPFACTVYEAKG
jgi:hypothetical protein